MILIRESHIPTQHRIEHKAKNTEFNKSKHQNLTVPTQSSNHPYNKIYQSEKDQTQKMGQP